MKLELVTLIVSIFSLIVWVFFDYLSFYLITKVKFRICDLLLTLYFIFSFYQSLVNLWFSAIASFFEVIIFYLWFENRAEKNMVLGASLIIAIIDTVNNVIINVLQLKNAFTIKDTLLSEVVTIVLLIITEIIIYNKKAEIFDILSSKADRVFLSLIAYFYISIELFSVIVTVSENKHIIILSLLIILILQFIFGIVAFYFYTVINQKILKAEKQKELQNRIEDIENYAEYLESTEDNLIKFRHDIKSLISSISLNTDDDKPDLVSYVDNYINKNSFERYQGLNHIKNKLLKNLFLTKIAVMINKNLNYNFECTQDAKISIENNEMFDLIRILGIAMDNAIEASTELGSKSRIDIMVFKNQSNGIEFEIKNLVKNENIRINEIQRSGVTSKVDHLGVGLANVKEIISKYSNMSLDLKIENKYFTFYLVVDEEEPL